MKKVKFFLVIITMILFSINLANAQPKNYSISVDDYTGIAYCGTEVVKGTQTTEVKWNKNTAHVKVHWSLIGQESGANYEAGFVRNTVNIDNGPNGALVGNFRFRFKAKRNNVPLGHGHMKGHLTINANGDVTVDYFDAEWICH